MDLVAKPDVEMARFYEEHRESIENLFRSSQAAEWPVEIEDFVRALWRSVQKSATSSPAAAREMLASIRAPDLALALACLAGNTAAWDHFAAAYRPALYEAARVFVHDEAKARELADSLFAELYGLDAAAPNRASRLAYFHGRSSLKTWLRAVLYQKFVDEYRRESRLDPLPEAPHEPPAAPQSVSEEDDRRYAACLGGAVEAVLQELPAGEKLLLGYYYVQQMTLKQIGSLSGESEATLSRRLESLRKKLRKRIENHLRRVEKLTALEVDRCLDFASRGVLVNLDKVLKTE
jgi:RNA polymerase sigma-70 factor, ECF subfamily